VVTVLQGVDLLIFLLIFALALQQCSANALPVIIVTMMTVLLDVSSCGSRPFLNLTCAHSTLHRKKLEVVRFRLYKPVL